MHRKHLREQTRMGNSGAREKHTHSTYPKKTHTTHRPPGASPGLPWDPGPPLAQLNWSALVLRARRGGPGSQGSPGEAPGGRQVEYVSVRVSLLPIARIPARSCPICTSAMHRYCYCAVYCLYAAARSLLPVCLREGMSKKPR